MGSYKSLYIGTFLGLIIGDGLLFMMDSSIPKIPVLLSNVLAIVFVILYTYSKKKKFECEEIPEIDERVQDNIKRYLNISFMMSFIILIFYICISKAVGRETLPIQEMFLMCCVLMAGSFSVATVFGKRA
ncbi:MULTISPECIES: hypothetical protein [unclassified Bacillus (in: firmicutes)]|uniref:hypothetical protein n=1 Tax=unclassified Bacillus (in: firmicutes) TaxID=185979 RepID=UPI00232C9B68|nr:hypothetical protein [Bacillus sp. BP-3]MDC2865481.1 hypothetical protein [Bacillus sp. BP-3]